MRVILFFFRISVIFSRISVFKIRKSENRLHLGNKNAQAHFVFLSIYIIFVHKE